MSSDLYQSRASGHAIVQYPAMPDLVVVSDSEEDEEVFSGEAIDLTAMRERLEKARGDRSMRGISKKARCGPGYYYSIVHEEKEPGVLRLARLCHVLDISLSYAVFGLEISPETEELVGLLEENPGRRDGILQALKS